MNQVAAISITEHPQSGSHRFRYECDGRSAGSIPGVSSTKDISTHPTVKLINCSGPGTIVVSLVTTDAPPRPHPHSLVGKDCSKGICTRRLDSGERTISFPGIGIQRKKRNDFKKAIEERLLQKVDPFKTHAQGNDIQAKDYDHTTVCLCFQVFLDYPDNATDNRKKFHVLTPVVSTPIMDKQATFELKILEFAPAVASCNGGEKIIILCDKVKQNEVEFVFHDGPNSWIRTGQPKTTVRRNDAFVLTVPPYLRVDLRHPVEVDMYLRMKSDPDEISEPVKFKYAPPYANELENPTNKKRKSDDGHETRENYLHGQPSVIDTAASAAGVSVSPYHSASAGSGYGGLDPLLSQTSMDPMLLHQNDSTQDTVMSDQGASQLLNRLLGEDFSTVNMNSPAQVTVDDWADELNNIINRVDSEPDD